MKHVRPSEALPVPFTRDQAAAPFVCQRRGGVQLGGDECAGRAIAVTKAPADAILPSYAPCLGCPVGRMRALALRDFGETSTRPQCVACLALAPEGGVPRPYFCDACQATAETPAEQLPAAPPTEARPPSPSRPTPQPEENPMPSVPERPTCEACGKRADGREPRDGWPTPYRHRRCELKPDATGRVCTNCEAPTVGDAYLCAACARDKQAARSGIDGRFTARLVGLALDADPNAAEASATLALESGGVVAVQLDASAVGRLARVGALGREVSLRVSLVVEP